VIKSFRKEFEEKIFELGYSISCQQGGFCVLYDKFKNHFLIVRLLISKQPNLLIHGSRNGLNIQAIGLFKFTYPEPFNIPDFFIFSFQNPSQYQTELLIIPESVLKNRIFEKYHRMISNKSVEIVCWLMSDGFVYNATHLSVEGEWYYLSLGVNGRMADGTDLDFTPFLNNWKQLSVH
jgi:hypothetical protein